ncbi:MAG TPA: hypothetical protein VOA41_20725 [Candidatus Dormibacteraeota bacterium]|nr:hypothetical protein [Candidatus Dormibacteraeota bacterium]
MRRAMVVACAFCFVPGMLVAQGKSTGVAESTETRRLQALEEQVHALAAQVELLRRELIKVRDPQPNGVAPSGRLVLTAGPGMEKGAAERTVSAMAQPSTPVSGEIAAMQPAAQEPSPILGGPQTQVFGGATSNAKLLNPDISVIGDFLGSLGRNKIRPVPALELHESEVSFQAIIDPYARGDFFLSFGETGVNVEEGYVTFTALPGGFVAKAGKMRAAFGKVNTIHNHALEWTDRPLVTENLLGGEDGINDAGFSVTRILPAPKWIFLEGTGQVFRGDSGNIFRADKHKDVSTVGHIRAYKDLSESSNVDIGFSYAHGHSAGDTLVTLLPSDFHTNLYGVDATFRWKPLRRAIYHSFLARTELVWSHRDQLSARNAFETQRAFGLYTSGEYRLTRRWTVGGRFDRSARAADANLRDTGFSALLTYWPSEFSQVRGQYRFARYAEKFDANELRFQLLFVLGAHGAHPF